MADEIKTQTVPGILKTIFIVEFEGADDFTIHKTVEGAIGEVALKGEGHMYRIFAVDLVLTEGVGIAAVEDVEFEVREES